MIHTPLGWIEQKPTGGWFGLLEIAPRSDAEFPENPIKRIEARTHDALMRKMLNEARFQLRMLTTMIHWAENQEWARRKGK